MYKILGKQYLPQKVCNFLIVLEKVSLGSSSGCGRTLAKGSLRDLGLFCHQCVQVGKEGGVQHSQSESQLLVFLMTF